MFIKIEYREHNYETPIYEKVINSESIASIEIGIESKPVINFMETQDRYWFVRNWTYKNFIKAVGVIEPD